MKKYIYSIVVIMSLCFMKAESQVNMTLLGNFPYSVNLADIWGYVDQSGNEYAIVGANNGVSIVDVTNPALPVEVFFEPGASSIWRDIKTWNDHAYITNESSDGLMIIDLSPLPGSTNLTVTAFTGSSYPFQSSHNLYITENGICYIFGSNYSNGGAIMIDLTVYQWATVEVGI